MVDFAGWEMPIQYSSIISEHKSVREAAGIFDVSQIEIYTENRDVLRNYTENTEKPQNCY